MKKDIKLLFIFIFSREIKNQKIKHTKINHYIAYKNEIIRATKVWCKI
jgi:hypothetical protein